METSNLMAKKMILNSKSITIRIALALKSDRFDLEQKLEKVGNFEASPEESRSFGQMHPWKLRFQINSKKIHWKVSNRTKRPYLGPLRFESLKSKLWIQSLNFKLLASKSEIWLIRLETSFSDFLELEIYSITFRVVVAFVWQTSSKPKEPNNKLFQRKKFRGWCSDQTGGAQFLASSTIYETLKYYLANKFSNFDMAANAFANPCSAISFDRRFEQKKVLKFELEFGFERFIMRFWIETLDWDARFGDRSRLRMWKHFFWPFNRLNDQ